SWTSRTFLRLPPTSARRNARTRRGDSGGEPDPSTRRSESNGEEDSHTQGGEAQDRGEAEGRGDESRGQEGGKIRLPLRQTDRRQRRDEAAPWRQRREPRRDVPHRPSRATRFHHHDGSVHLLLRAQANVSP